VSSRPYGLFYAIELPGKAFATYPNAHGYMAKDYLALCRNEVTEDKALEIARGCLHDNALSLYPPKSLRRRRSGRRGALEKGRILAAP
jgi:hypothetical protein